MTPRVLAAAWLAAFLLVTPAAADKLKVVASFSILGDIAARVAGDRAEIRTLVGPDGDAHVFEPTPADARAVAQAQIFLVNGWGFEPWAERLAKSTNARATLVIATSGVRPLPFHVGGQGATSTGLDPHAWQNVQNVLIYTENIKRALIAADTANTQFYLGNATAYLKELRSLDTGIRASVSAIPANRRRVITTHDAFAYFGKAYGVEFIAPLGTSTEEQASAKEMAALIRQIRRENVSAIFVENVADPRMIQQVARETGAKLGGKLYSDALSAKDGPAPSYVAMMRQNAKLLTEAMAPGS
ncbi:MAG: metal ABC transporter substrate-binding protein [Alphaproteobacteria bacterium]|nr:metal ABC transporter substrate-binding protein [Alphaproteobacteria bacterium]